MIFVLKYPGPIVPQTYKSLDCHLILHNNKREYMCFYRKRGSLPKTIVNELKQISYYIKNNHIDKTIEDFWYWLNMHNINGNYYNSRMFTKPMAIVSNPMLNKSDIKYNEYTYKPVRFHKIDGDVTYLYDVNVDTLELNIVTKQTRRYFIHRYGVYKRRILSKRELTYHSKLNS